VSTNRPPEEGEFARRTAELYDVSDDYVNDIAFIKELMAGKGIGRVLEPFSGSGGIMAPLLEAGFEVCGLDYDQAMIDRAWAKIDQLGQEAAGRATIQRMDVIEQDWPCGYDLVLLAANCFWQLGGPAEQEACIAKAAASLTPGGYIYIENDNMEGELPDSWCVIDDEPRPWKFPSGTCRDGTKVRSLIQVVDFDKARRLWRACRRIILEKPDGAVVESDWRTHTTHPSSAADIERWLTRHGFEILGKYSSTDAEPYHPGCQRAIFWAKICKCP
jgi:hypothetical protein